MKARVKVVRSGVVGGNDGKKGGWGCREVKICACEGGWENYKQNTFRVNLCTLCVLIWAKYYMVNEEHFIVLVIGNLSINRCQHTILEIKGE